MMAGAFAPRLHEIVGQIHHFAEAMVHHREASVGCEHAQPVRHIVQRGVELAGQRRLALARHERLHEYPVQIGRDLFERHEETLQLMTDMRDVIGCATHRQRDHGRTEDKCGLQLEYPRPSIGPARASRQDSRW